MTSSDSMSRYVRVGRSKKVQIWPPIQRRGEKKEVQIWRQKTDYIEFLANNVPTTLSEAAKLPCLRHRFRRATPFAKITVVDNGQRDSLLGRMLLNQSRAQTHCQKMHGFGGCIEKFLSACRINVRMVVRRTYRRRARSSYEKMPRAYPRSQAAHKQDKTLSCLGRARRWNVRRIFGHIIKIEEEIVASVPRSVLYYV